MEGEWGQKCNWIEFHAIGPLTPCHWTIRHHIGLYTSCHWIGLQFIGSYVIPSDHIFYVIGADFISSDRTSCHWIGLLFIGSDFMYLDQKRHSIGLAANRKKFVSQSAFEDMYQQIWRVTCRVNTEQYKKNATYSKQHKNDYDWPNQKQFMKESRST